MRMLLYVDDLDRLGTKDEKAVEVRLGLTHRACRFQMHSDQPVRSGSLVLEPWL